MSSPYTNQISINPYAQLSTTTANTQAQIQQWAQLANIYSSAATMSYTPQAEWRELPSRWGKFVDDLKDVARWIGLCFGCYCQKTKHWYLFRRTYRMAKIKYGNEFDRDTKSKWCSACRVAYLLNATK